MDKINPLQYITDFDPVPEAVIDASGWFETEYLTITQRWNFSINAAWGPWPGNYLQWYMAQGWVLESTTVIDPVTGGPPDAWDVAADFTYSLKRRKLQSERVLNSLITDFTTAYNEGREVNDTRYDELVALYNAMLSKSEDQLILDAGTDTTYDGLIVAIIGNIESDYTAYAADVDGDLDAYGDSLRDQINARFDAAISTARQDLVSRGMYNTTVWTSALAGIERERSLSLSDFEDKNIQQTLGLKHKVYAEQSGMRTRILAARDRLHSQLQAASDVRLATRNTILTAMLAFMERRQDEYPELSGLADIAAKLGYGDSPSTVMP